MGKSQNQISQSTVSDRLGTLLFDFSKLELMAVKGRFKIILSNCKLKQHVKAFIAILVGFSFIYIYLIFPILVTHCIINTTLVSEFFPRRILTALKNVLW